MYRRARGLREEARQHAVTPALREQAGKALEKGQVANCAFGQVAVERALGRCSPPV
jgi:hypothetical protein